MTTQLETRALSWLGLTWRQLAGVAGIVAIILVVLEGILMGDVPTIEDSVAGSRAWFEANSTRVLWSYYLGAMGWWILMVPFLLGLRSLLMQAEGGEALWTQAGFFGAVLFLILGDVTAGTAILALAIDDLDDGALRALQHWTFFHESLFASTAALYLAGTGVAILRTAVLWRWLGWLQLLLVVLGIIGAAAIVDGDPEGALAILGFIAATGVGVVIVAQSLGLLIRRGA